MKNTTVFILLYSIVINGQTLLNSGDLLVIGFENNIQTCNPAGNQNDVFYFVCAQDIVPNTVIDFTDNGWERAYPNFWGTTEGFYRFEYVGATIPAGSVFSISFPNNSSNVQTWNPDWLFTNLSGGITSINFTAMGDQLFVMQGGTWDAPVQNQGTYSGTLIYVCNNNSDWVSENSTSTSGLPISLQCYSTLVPVNGGDYIYYSGPLTPVPLQEWQQRLNVPTNWTEVATCIDFEQNFNIQNISILQEQKLCAPDNQEVCINESSDALTLQTNYDDVSYQWYVNSEASYTNAVAISNAVDISYTPSTNTAGTFYYFCEIMVNRCTRFSNISEITVYPLPITSDIQSD